MSGPQTRLRPAVQPTMYFVGVSTARSSINPVFRAWAPELHIDDACLIGIDLTPGSPRESYREVVSFIASDPLSVGSLVTTHKIDVYLSCGDLFGEISRDAAALGEISCIAKRDGRLVGAAFDPVTSGFALEAFLPEGYWQSASSDVLLLGAGGSATALMCYLSDPRHGSNRPRRIVATARRAERLEKIRGVHDRLGFDVPLETVQVTDVSVNDAALAALAPGSLVVNASGLGKDAPGSPLSDAAVFPLDSLAWDFNYRGNLVFLDQARRQAVERRLTIEDGWVYFVHGWTRCIAEIFHLDIPVSGPAFDRLLKLAEVAR
jgi:shikimate 5-dehydrogenase